MAAASAAALLSACGEGGSSSGGGTISSGGSPTPSPSSPTPSPSPTYATFAASLSGNATFASSCSAFSYAGSFPATNPATPFGQGLTIGYTASTQTYTITGDGNSLSFGPGDLVTGSVSGPARYSKAGASGGTDGFSISGNLTYARALSVATRKSGAPITYYCVIGVPTLTTDVPPLATYTFSPIAIAGPLIDYGVTPSVSYNLRPTTVTFSVDLTTQRVTASLHLIGEDATGAQKDFGTYTGDGTVDASTGIVYGAWTSPGRDVFGNFGGTFFGPQGKEVALSYNISSRPTGSGGQLTTLSTGYFYGAR